MIPYTPYKIPLKNRLDAVKIGHVIDPAYFPAAVDRMEKIPISAYLSGFDKEKAVKPSVSYRRGTAGTYLQAGGTGHTQHPFIQSA